MVFGSEYAASYDYLYHDKDYEKECDFIEGIFSKKNHRVSSILDLGCGTGGHAILLAKRGYNVTGIDRSEQMLNLARKKSKSEGLEIDFIEKDIIDLDLGKCFDAVISMFAVMSYQIRNNEVAKVCGNAFKHLNENGIFVFDCWNGMAVITERPTNRLKEVKINKDEGIIRFTNPICDIQNQTVDVRFKVWNTRGKSILNQTDESHKMRFFFPQEIKYFLQVAGFKEIETCPFLYPDRPVSENDWNMALIAEKGLKNRK